MQCPAARPATPAHLFKVPPHVLSGRKPGFISGRVLLEPCEQRVRPGPVHLHLQAMSGRPVAARSCHSSLGCVWAGSRHVSAARSAITSGVITPALQQMQHPGAAGSNSNQQRLPVIHSKVQKPHLAHERELGAVAGGHKLLNVCVAARLLLPKLWPGVRERGRAQAWAQHERLQNQNLNTGQAGLPSGASGTCPVHLHMRQWGSVLGACWA